MDEVARPGADQGIIPEGGPSRWCWRDAGQLQLIAEHLFRQLPAAMVHATDNDGRDVPIRHRQCENGVPAPLDPCRTAEPRVFLARCAAQPP